MGTVWIDAGCAAGLAGHAQSLRAAQALAGLRFVAAGGRGGFAELPLADALARFDAPTRPSLLRRLAARFTSAAEPAFADGDVLLAGDRLLVRHHGEWTTRGGRGQQAIDAGATGLAAVAVAIAAAYAQGDGYEQRLQHLYTHWLRPGDHAIDVGAHGGRHAVPMACCVGPSGRVLGFEPNPPIAAATRALAGALGLGQFELREAALSDTAGVADFVVAVDRPEESGLLERTYNGETRTQHIQVPVARIDDEAVESLRFLKVDTEGAEASVLRGAAETLRRLRPLVSFEFGEMSYAAYGVDPVAVHGFLSGLGYAVLGIFGDALDAPAFDRASREQRYWDYVACPAGHVEEVQAILRSFRP